MTSPFASVFNFLSVMIAQFYAAPSNSARLQTWPAIPLSIAGVTLNVICTRQKQYHTMNSATAAFRLSSFLLMAFVLRQNLLRWQRTLRLALSIWEVRVASAFTRWRVPLSLIGWTWNQKQESNYSNATLAQYPFSQSLWRWFLTPFCRQTISSLP